MIADAELTDAIDAVIYADVFDSAVSLEDARRFARARLAETDLEDARLAAVLVSHRGAVALRPRSELLARHAAETERAEDLARRARRVARVLRHTPFVRGIALTGSVAARSAGHDADVDLMVIVAEDRIGTVFLALGPASRVLGRRLFCPNLYVSEASMQIEPTTPYVERELAQARMLVGPAGAIRDANPWLERTFPNLAPSGSTLPARSGLQRVLEWVVGGRLEQRARRIAERRLDAHYRGHTPTDVVARLRSGEALRFHRGDLDRSVPARYASRRAEIEAALSPDARDSM